MNIEHIALNVGNVIEHVQWYVDHLGMEVIRKIDSPHQIHFLADEARRTVIELYSNPAAPVLDFATQDDLTFHIAFSVENIDAEIQRLTAVGATLVSEPRETPAGDFLAMLRDPWGVCIQLAQRRIALL